MIEVELNFQQIKHAYQQNTPVLCGIDLTIASGQFVALVGRSGCGKTTLLRLAAGLLRADSGSIYLEGSVIREPSEQVAVVFQSPVLLQWRTVLDNVLLPISLHRSVKAGDRNKAKELLQLVGLEAHMYIYPNQLSGGQQSRVALVRALLQNPKVLLLDEPFAALDALTREDLQQDLLRFCRESGLTTMFITHDITEAVYVADRVVVMHGGRISLDMEVPLAKPLSLEIRYDAAFNQLCLQARLAMEAQL